MWVVAQAPPETPVGPEFGKASPVGLFILVVLGVVILGIGYAFHRRLSRFNRRRLFAEQHGIDPFDREAIDAAMEEAGLRDLSRTSYL
ncbi:hypothetical protein [Corynebacterium liangguodongii]|uniref:Uncharacterized protein n=1 Tax=Corynebacterium liangguodongii TaxID=2079535 RepID=A0A2S0WGW2_9CORY|nr:hypothetical protein [Corynebacterium liangguodongii]AWB85028.1 hypothetical protein C3E79_03885 [Corynebacterium liangguodongii]PWB99597.1 hypothetical protein DF219_05910 [Corynebacterium liangguodongii]